MDQQRSQIITRHEPVHPSSNRRCSEREQDTNGSESDTGNVRVSICDCKSFGLSTEQAANGLSDILRSDSILDEETGQTSCIEVSSAAYPFNLCTLLLEIRSQVKNGSNSLRRRLKTKASNGRNDTTRQLGSRLVGDNGCTDYGP